MPPAHDSMHKHTSASSSSNSERACDACRIRKLKCPSLLAHKTTGQACARCVKTGLLCTYDAPPRKRGPASGKRLSALRQNQKTTGAPARFSPEPRQASSLRDITPSDASSPPVPLASSALPLPLSPTFGQPAGPSRPYPPLDPIQTINAYVDFGYAAFPVLSRSLLLSRVAAGAQRTDPDFHALLRGLETYNEACRLRSDPLRGEDHLLELVQCTQAVRAEYDFAENPTLDTVVVSLFLFVAWNVMGRHKRAFLYLTEAIGLLDSVDPPPPRSSTRSEQEEAELEAERIRRTRIEYVMFVTENASVSIYGTPSKRRLARRPAHIVRSADALRLPSTRARHTGGAMEGKNGMGERDMELNMERLDREAMDLLVLMTHLHAASDINEIINVGASSAFASNTGPNNNTAGTSGNLIPSVFFRSHASGPVYPTQSADVAITRQWMLASKLPLLLPTCQTNPLAMTGLATILHDMGFSVLHSISQLPAGQLRIVGLGKVTAIARTIYDLAGGMGCGEVFDQMLRGLVGAVGENDWEGMWLPTLRECVERFGGGIPASLPAPSSTEDAVPRPTDRTTHVHGDGATQEPATYFDLAQDGHGSDFSRVTEDQALEQIEIDSPATQAQQQHSAAQHPEVHERLQQPRQAFQQPHAHSAPTINLPSQLPAPPQLSNFSPSSQTSWQPALPNLWDAFQPASLGGLSQGGMSFPLGPIPGGSQGMHSQTGFTGMGAAMGVGSGTGVGYGLGMGAGEDVHFQGALASLLGL